MANQVKFISLQSMSIIGGNCIHCHRVTQRQNGMTNPFKCLKTDHGGFLLNYLYLMKYIYIFKFICSDICKLNLKKKKNTV